MRDLSDPENPHRSQYEQWDRWCYEHARGLSQEDVMAWYNDEAPAGWELLWVRVDKDGFVVPLRMSYAEDQRRMHDADFEPELDCRFSLRGGGIVDPQLLELMRRMQAEIRAPYIPPVPEWLAAAPPQWAQLMPGGEVVTLGPPGKTDESESPRAAYTLREAVDVYYRFSPDGELLAQVAPHEPWYKLYFTDFDVVVGEIGEQQMWWEYSGYIFVNDTQTRQVKAVYDYDGTPVDDDPEGLYRRRNRFEALTGDEIPLIYEAQQR